MLVEQEIKVGNQFGQLSIFLDFRSGVSGAIVVFEVHENRVLFGKLVTKRFHPGHPQFCKFAGSCSPGNEQHGISRPLACSRLFSPGMTRNKRAEDTA